MNSKGIGQPVRRKEDARLVVGAGCFSDDVDLPRQARAFVIRSVHAHARIKAVDVARAKAMPGVLAVLTGADYKADGGKSIPPDPSLTAPFEVQRVTGVPMEARTAVGNYDARSGRYFLHAGSGGVVRQKAELAGMLGVPLGSVQVVAHDIGGNFGTKNSIFPEFPLLLWASRRIGRPVKWTCERSEAFLSDYQGRDLVAEVELALDARGRFLALRGSHLSNIGGYSSSIVPLRKGIGICSGLYP